MSAFDPKGGIGVQNEFDRVFEHETHVKLVGTFLTNGRLILSPKAFCAQCALLEPFDSLVIGIFRY